MFFSSNYDFRLFFSCFLPFPVRLSRLFGYSQPFSSFLAALFPAFLLPFSSFLAALFPAVPRPFSRLFAAFFIGLSAAHLLTVFQPFSIVLQQLPSLI